jgi:hypothetical protein
LISHFLFHDFEGIVKAKEGVEYDTAIRIALVTLKHDSPCYIGPLVDCGAPLVLTRCLARSLRSSSRLNEVAGICELLLVLFRCSKYFAIKALQEVAGELLPLLLCILFLSHSARTWTAPTHVKRLIERVSTIPIQLELVQDKASLLNVFREAILMCCIDVVDKTTLTGIFQLLTSLVLNASSRRTFYSDPSLIEVTLANYSHLRKAKCHFAAFLLVAAQDLDSRKKILSFPTFVRVLSSMLRENELEARKFAIAIMKLAATERAGRTRLIMLGGSSLLSAVFENARIDETNESSMELIRQLICSDTAKLFHDNDKLLLPMLQAERWNEESSLLVAKIIYRLSGILYAHAKGMSRFLEAILQICSSDNHPNVRILGARSLMRQSKVEACNFFLLRTPAAAIVIARLASDEDSEVNSIGTKVIGNLASNPLNHRALTKNSFLIGPLAASVEQKHSSEALKALFNLADNSKCNRALAKQINVVASLSKYGVSSSIQNKKLQNAALTRVVKLVPMM